MKTVTHKLKTVGIAVAAALVFSSAAWVNGCSAPPASSPPGVQTGAVALALGAGLSVASVAYAITGPNRFTKSGSIDVSHSAQLSAIVSGLPAGIGFTITLHAAASDGRTTCLGSATFDVMAGATTAVTVRLDCHQAAATGSVAISGTINVCPVADGVTATPAEVAVGSALSLFAAAHDADGGPAPLSYHWTASSGTLSDAASPSPSFTCGAAGSVTLTVSISDGDAGCVASQSVSVTCSGHNDAALAYRTTTKIKHLVVIFGENISYDHYFGTYPGSANLTGEAPAPSAAAPSNNNLSTPLDPTAGFAPISGSDLLNMNPNLNAANGGSASNPFRLPPSAA